jgi:hypothetical protein
MWLTSAKTPFETTIVTGFWLLESAPFGRDLSSRATERSWGRSPSIIVKCVIRTPLILR